MLSNWTWPTNVRRMRLFLAESFCQFAMHSTNFRQVFSMTLKCSA